MVDDATSITVSHIKDKEDEEEDEDKESEYWKIRKKAKEEGKKERERKNGKLDTSGLFTLTRSCHVHFFFQSIKSNEIE